MFVNICDYQQNLNTNMCIYDIYPKVFFKPLKYKHYLKKTILNRDFSYEGTITLKIRIVALKGKLRLTVKI